MENVATYSEARSEYTKQLATFIVPVLVGWFQQTWHRNAGNRQQCLALFQSECEEVARWNADRIHDEVRVLIERSGCDYMEELMTAVFVAHTKVLTAVRLSSREKKLSITVPKLDHFVHRIFKEAARIFWKSPFLFMDGGSVVERQKNVLQIEALATEAIGTAVRSLLPVKQILKDYLEGDHEELEDETVPVGESQVGGGVASEAPEPTVPVAAPAPPVAVPAPAPEPSTPAVPQLEVSEKEVAVSAPVAAPQPAAAPAVVNIDTEHAVKFSSYDDVYDEAADGPSLQYRSREGDDMDEMTDGALQINDSSARALSGPDDGIEDLDVPLPPAPKAAAPPMSDKISDDEVMDLN